MKQYTIVLNEDEMIDLASALSEKRMRELEDAHKWNKGVARDEAKRRIVERYRPLLYKLNKIAGLRF